MYREKPPTEPKAPASERFNTWWLDRKIAMRKRRDDLKVFFKSFTVGEWLLFIVILVLLGFVVSCIDDCCTRQTNDEAHRREMVKLCLPDHFADEKKVAVGLYQIECLSPKGEGRKIFQERSGN